MINDGSIENTKFLEAVYKQSFEEISKIKGIKISYTASEIIDLAIVTPFLCFFSVGVLTY